MSIEKVEIKEVDGKEIKTIHRFVDNRKIRRQLLKREIGSNKIKNAWHNRQKKG